MTQEVRVAREVVYWATIQWCNGGLLGLSGFHRVAIKTVRPTYFHAWFQTEEKGVLRCRHKPYHLIYHVVYLGQLRGIVLQLFNVVSMSTGWGLKEDQIYGFVKRVWATYLMYHVYKEFLKTLEFSFSVLCNKEEQDRE